MKKTLRPRITSKLALVRETLRITAVGGGASDLQQCLSTHASCTETKCPGTE